MTCCHISQHTAAVALTPHLKAATDADDPYPVMVLPFAYELLFPGQSALVHNTVANLLQHN